jgi:methyl-accepting chemotaxis protein PixJ
MNSEPSLFTVKPTQLDLPSGEPPNRLQSFLQKHLVSTIIVSACLNLSLTGISTWGVWQTSQNLEATVAKQAKLQDLRSKLKYLDEVLTMSAHMWTNTAQPIWEKRYNDTVSIYDKTILELTKDIPSPKLDADTKQLMQVEDRAFKLAKAGRIKEAPLLLMSPKYLQTKQSYTGELDSMFDRIKISVDSLVREERQSLSNSIALALISLGLLVATSSLVVVIIRSYIRDRETAQKSLEVVQTDLILLNGYFTYRYQSYFGCSLRSRRGESDRSG